MEVYYKPQKTKATEKIFQKEFEYFMFNNGYFSVSEGQIGNARYDNILFDENNAFLCEHKYIKETKPNKIIQSAKTQTKIYHERLKVFTRLTNDVYILLFSNNYLKFKDGIWEIKKDGLNFKFVLICLNKNTPPSKIQKMEDIDILKLLE